MNVLLSGAKLAAKLGVSPPMVTKYKREGKIQEEPGGGYILKKVKSQLANTLGSKQGGVPRRGDREPNRSRTAPETKSPHPKRRSTSDANSVSKADLEKQALAERIRRERLRNDQLEGILVNRAEVEAATEARFRADAESLLDWPASIAPDLAAELGTDERQTHAALEKYVRQFMQERSMLPLPA